MAGMGRTPKPADLLQRRNRSANGATLEEQPRRRLAPKLPTSRTWQDLTLTWWRDIWRSPMAPEFLSADTHGLIRLARLVDDFWLEEDGNKASKLAGEIRLQGQLYGLSPIDRRRLQWEVARGDEAERKRVKPAPSSVQPDPAADPRSVLRALA